MTINDEAAFKRAREVLLQRRIELRDRAAHVERDLRRENDPLSADADDQAIQRENDETPIEF